MPKKGRAALCSLNITQASVVAACVQLQQFFTSQLQQEKFLAAKLPPGERTAEQQLHAWYVKRRLPGTLTLCRQLTARLHQAAELVFGAARQSDKSAVQSRRVWCATELLS